MIKEILLKYNQPGPRYTSYPPANFFSEKFTSDDYRKALINSNNGKPESISLYFHVPFCPKMCWFCGCNTDLLDKKDKLDAYFNALLKEIDTVAPLLSKNRKITQIHWGGGTPNSVAVKYIEKVIDKINSYFSISENAEIAMECSPAYLSKKYINKLKNLGFNRISLGVQDFNRDVLNTVNRALPKYPVKEIVYDIRDAGFDGVNIDLIYGLPLQTTESFLKNIEQTAEIKPDRVVTFSYAHVPWVKPAQKKLEQFGLPQPDEKLDMLLSGYKKLLNLGYESIGMDHFALPDDELAYAKREKLLHRNFQGYCTKETTGQVYAFGSTGISQLYDAYSQNTKNTALYIKMINEKGFATERGYKLSTEEMIIRDIINEIMCNGILDFNELADKNNFSVEYLKKICNFNPDKLDSFITDGLMNFSDDKLTVSETGMAVVRNIAMTFDPYLSKDTNMYSKTI